PEVFRSRRSEVRGRKARSREQGAGSRELGAGSLERGVGSREHGASGSKVKSISGSLAFAGRSMLHACRSMPVAPGFMLSPQPTQRRRRFVSKDITQRRIALRLLMADVIFLTEVFDFDDVVRHGRTRSQTSQVGGQTQNRTHLIS